MIKPTDDVLKAFAHVAQNVPRVGVFLAEWETIELDRLPHAVGNVAVAQGRCQVLREVNNLLNTASGSVAP